MLLVWFCRLKRSHSTSFNLDDADVEFRRGGVRATAGPRLGWSREPKHRCVPLLLVMSVRTHDGPAPLCVSR